MPRVILGGELRHYTGAVEEVSIEALNYRAARRELQKLFPRLQDAVLDKFAVAIDGVMVQTPLLETLQPDSELVFIPRIAGG